jgi:hypothetical protein
LLNGALRQTKMALVNRKTESGKICVRARLIIFLVVLFKFEVVLECCHKVDPDNEVLIFGRSLPTSKYDVNTLIFPKSDIVEMIATDVDKDFALKSKCHFECEFERDGTGRITVTERELFEKF